MDFRGPDACKPIEIKKSLPRRFRVLSNSPVSDCSACSLGIASAGRCRLSPTARESGATICAQGERPRTVYFVKEGFVSLSSVSPRGAELLLSLRGPSSLLCTEALQNEASAFEVRALSRIKICGIAAESMAQWIGPERSAARVVLDLLLTEGRQQRDEVNWRQGDCLSRVARFALAHARFLADRPTAVRKQVVARLLGMRPETLSRCLTRLEKEGVVDASRGVRVLDNRRLAAIAMEDGAA
jgi:CRP/FNR family transcriptional regulator, cyclic AMP receptor protein